MINGYKRSKNRLEIVREYTYYTLRDCVIEKRRFPACLDRAENVKGKGQKYIVCSNESCNCKSNCGFFDNVK